MWDGDGLVWKLSRALVATGHMQSILSQRNHITPCWYFWLSYLMEITPAQAQSDPLPLATTTFASLTSVWLLCVSLKEHVVISESSKTSRTTTCDGPECWAYFNPESQPPSLPESVHRHTYYNMHSHTYIWPVSNKCLPYYVLSVNLTVWVSVHL